MKTNLKPTTSTGSGRKMALVICHKCKSKVDKKCTILCSVTPCVVTGTNFIVLDILKNYTTLQVMNQKQSGAVNHVKWVIIKYETVEIQISLYAREKTKTLIKILALKSLNLQRLVLLTGYTCARLRAHPKIQEHRQKYTRKKFHSACSPIKNTIDNNEFQSQENSQSTPHSISSSSKTSDTHLLSETDGSRSMDEPLSPSAVLAKSVDGLDRHGPIQYPNLQNQNHELQEKITDLETALSSTENELENKIIENNELHRKNNQLSMEVKVLKSLCYSASSDIKNIPSARKRNRNSLVPDILSSPASPIVATATLEADKSLESNKKLLNLQLKINEFEKLLKNIKKEMKALGNQVKSLANVLQSPELKFTSNTSAAGAMEELPMQAAYQIPATCRKVSSTLLQSKLCVLSNYRKTTQL